MGVWAYRVLSHNRLHVKATLFSVSWQIDKQRSTRYITDNHVTLALHNHRDSTDL